METIKFNVGDEVLEIQPHYSTNVFHIDTHLIRTHIVKSANDKSFSVYRNEISNYGADSGLMADQCTGKIYSGETKYYHKDKDRQEIREILNEVVISYVRWTKEEDVNRIAVLQKQIELAKFEIAKIKEGEGQWEIGFSYKKNKEWLEKILLVINKHFPL